MVTATCHCGKVSIEVETEPTEITACNCSLCRRTGGLWAYYSPKQVRVTGKTDTYLGGDKTLFTHRCTDCGCITHWLAVDPAYDRMGVNSRMMPPEAVAAARIRHLDGADTWTSWIEEPRPPRKPPPQD
ncbi:MAG: GFA family protein [Alphaproteobacteria bacterium]|nr:GFA family protein [Alphaproteobacteria bacterium]MDE2109758.1 GFA family protein [Alphaproteobacteria bacterium]MDE2494382.1 GFA family protein [Alphaproteobacteria bacterium]